MRNPNQIQYPLVENYSDQEIVFDHESGDRVTHKIGSNIDWSSSHTNNGLTLPPVSEVESFCKSDPFYRSDHFRFLKLSLIKLWCKAVLVFFLKTNGII